MSAESRVPHHELNVGHIGAILSVVTTKPRDAGHYRRLLRHFRNLSHVTVEVQQT